MGDVVVKQPRKRLKVGTSVLLGGLLAVVAMDLIPPASHEVGPARLTARTLTGVGRTRLLIPPLGAVEANTHPGPLSIELSLAELDVEDLADALQRDPDGSDLSGVVASDLRALALSLGLRAVVGGALLGAIGLALLPRRRWPYVAGGAAGGGATMAILVGVAAGSFSVEAFTEPKFTGTLARAPVVIEALNDNEISFPEVQNRFDVAANRLTGLLALLNQPNLDPRRDSVAILHISDVHSNPIGLEIARQLARRFEVDAVVDTGDLTNFGVSLETRFATLVRRFDVPYILVPGNHDSKAVRLALQTIDNVTVLDGSLTEVDGIRILGFSDPTYSNWNATTHEEVLAAKEEAARDVTARVAQVQPDVVAVHDHRLVDGSYGLTPLVLSGHYHRQIVEAERGTRLLGVGSTGAAGLKSFTVESDMSYEAEIVYFRDGVAVAFDYVRFTGLDSDFVIERQTLGDLGPLDPPSPSPTGSVGATP